MWSMINNFLLIELSTIDWRKVLEQTWNIANLVKLPNHSSHLLFGS